jgi:putative transposase
MKLTAKVKLIPTETQADSLKRTLETANTACNHISDLAWDAKQFGQFQIHKLAYYEIKAALDLSAQLIVRCIAKVCDAYKLDKKTKRTFKPLGSIPYDLRILSWKMDKSIVSIWTVDGREKIPFVCGDYHRARLVNQRGESDLCLIDGNFYLFTTCDIDEPTIDDIDDFLGVDMGVANIAVDSDKTIHQGKSVKKVRYRHRTRRTKLQMRGTQSARRRLRKLLGKERRFATWTNHNISKEIVAKAKDTDRGIAIEELGGIRDRVTVRRSQRATLSSWSFAQLRSFIEYKAKRAGVKVVAVEPRNTSRTCPCCGHVDKANRKTQDKFLCVDCGFSGLADYIAAVNIRSRAVVNRPDIPTTPALPA